MKAPESCAHLSSCEAQLWLLSASSASRTATLSDSVQGLCRAPGIQFSSLVCWKVKIVAGVLGWVRCQKAKREWQHGGPWEADGHGELAQVGSSWAVVSHSSPHFGLLFPTIHLTEALLLVWLGGESERGAGNQPLPSVQVIFTRSVCVGAAKGLVLASGGLWEYVGGPGCTRLTSEAADVGERLLTAS